jgi:UDP-galactopyranose mutase
VIAERIATVIKEKVLIIEKRNHIGGNCYDHKDKNNILVHKYGPHIFHTDDREVWDYLSQFTDWIYYQHRVLGYIDGKYVPIPFNLDTLYQLLPENVARGLEKKLIDKYGYNKKVSILELKKVKDKDLSFLAKIIYDKVFLNYTKKQWGLRPEEIDTLVTARIPILISHDDRYFQDRYQAIPKEGYTKLFEKMLQNKNIEIQLGTNFKDIKNELKYKKIFYTGPIDMFFDYKFGKLDYRSVNIDFQTYHMKSYQAVAVINYPNNYDYTRITEFKKLTLTESNYTTIGIEYPGNNGFMAWPILNEKNKSIFKKYWQEANELKRENIYFVGRLAEYKYYDMDDSILNSLQMFDKILKSD